MHPVRVKYSIYTRVFTVNKSCKLRKLAQLLTVVYFRSLLQKPVPAGESPALSRRVCAAKAFSTAIGSNPRAAAGSRWRERCAADALEPLAASAFDLDALLDGRAQRALCRSGWRRRRRATAWAMGAGIAQPRAERRHMHAAQARARTPLHMYVRPPPPA